MLYGPEYESKNRLSLYARFVFIHVTRACPFIPILCGTFLLSYFILGMVSQDSNAIEEPARAKDLWFDDGNLILKAGDTLFRIYAGLLAARSSVFRDMLSFPPPKEGNPILDGCPIVFVYDSPNDLAHFLRAVFDSR